MPNLHARSSRTSLDRDATALHDAVCILDDYADDLHSVGCTPARVGRVRATADALTNISTRPLLPNVTEVDFMLAQVNWLRLRTRRARERGANVVLSTEMATEFANLIERFAVGIGFAHVAASLEVRPAAPGREARRV